MNDIELLYFEKEISDIKKHCIMHNQTIKYKGKTWYLYDGKIYDEDMNIFIEFASNGFLDLYEYFEYFPQMKGEN